MRFFSLITATLISLSAVSSFADQCAYLSLPQAQAAASVLNEYKYIYLAEVNGFQSKIVAGSRIGGAEVRQIPAYGGKYYAVFVDGIARDMAYLYVPVRQKGVVDEITGFNVGALAGCQNQSPARVPRINHIFSSPGDAR